MENIFNNYILYEKFYRSLVSSLWFSFFVRLIFLFIFLKISTFILVRIENQLLDKANNDETKKQIATLFDMITSVVKVSIVLMFLLAFISKAGIDVKPILATAGIAGIAIGFAAKSFLEDIISGLAIISSGQLRLGDYVDIGGKTGTVEKINVKMIMLRDVDGKVHFIRNGIVDIVTNYSLEYSYMLCDISVSYDADTEKVKEAMREAYNELLTDESQNNKIKSDIEILGLTSFEDSGIIMRARIKTLPKEQWSVGRSYNEILKRVFEKHGIEIPYPHQTVILKNN